MNNIKIENEELFNKRQKAKQTINSLYERGIYTIQDFLDCDVNSSFNDPATKRRYIAYQFILKAKYLGESLPYDYLLDIEICPEQNIENELRTLGFDCYDFLLRRKIKDNIRMIDLIDKIDEKEFGNLREFYLNYYNNQKKEISYRKR